MKTLVDQAIVLRRTNYGEADRIVTLLTARNGKIACLARGVRKPKSKLAAGIEPFCVNEISFIQGKGELATLTSTKLLSHHTGFLTDIKKLELAQQILKNINQKTEDHSGGEYFDLLNTAIKCVDSSVDASLVELWWLVNFSKTNGHDINTANQVNGENFSENVFYLFDLDRGGFLAHPEGVYNSAHIKFLKLAQRNSPVKLVKVIGYEKLTAEILPSIRSFAKLHLT